MSLHVKKRIKKGTELLAHLAGLSLQFFFEKSTIDVLITSAGNDFVEVKRAFVDKFAKRKKS